MTAISKAWVTIVDGQVDPDSPLDAALMQGLRDDLVHLREWLGASYTAGAVQNHSHDGVDSALVPIGANAIRNSSFESGTTSWTISANTGGTIAINTANAMDGLNCLAFTSTILANGGGSATGDEFIPCSPGLTYSIRALVNASAANISSAVSIVWYDSAKTPISTTNAYLTTSTPTAPTQVGGDAIAPASAKWMKAQLYGGVPSYGSATGTVYMDGTYLIRPHEIVQAGAAYAAHILSISNAVVGAEFATTSTSAVEAFNARVMVNGTYRIAFDLRVYTGWTGYGRIYKNGVAYGTSRSTASTTDVQFTEDLAFSAGDTMQIFIYTNSSATTNVWANDVMVGIDTTIVAGASMPNSIKLGLR